MQLTTPKQVTWVIAVILGVAGILSSVITIPGLTPSAFLLVSVGFALLALGNILKGL